MSSKKRLDAFEVRHITAADPFQPATALASLPIPVPVHFPVFGSTCTTTCRTGEALDVLAPRVTELFFKRTELISRSLSGSYEISREEALKDLVDQLEATNDNHLGTMWAIPWAQLSVRFRKVVGRARAKVAKYTQAEIRVPATPENGNIYYVFYFNFLPCDVTAPNLQRCNFAFGFQQVENGEFRVYYAVLPEVKEDVVEAMANHTNSMVKGIAHWVLSGKQPNALPLSCIDSEYYEYLAAIRKGPVVTELSSIWNTYERTNKAKHLFEDVGIVAYLATLWKANDPTSPKINFVDVGCGNGVASYLLNTVYGDKIQGVSYDIKARRIWDFYKKKGVNCHEVTPIIPKFPDLELPFPKNTNWIVGIHTDEMTPWIALFAMKMKCNFFLLPCCPFDFYGKFNKQKFSTGNEWEYFTYIVRVAEALGFDVKTDGLKIPSEKKTAIIGLVPENGKLLPDYDSDWVRTIDSIMEPSRRHNGVRHFAPRKAEIEVKNCSKIPFDIRDSINKVIVDDLLALPNPATGLPLQTIISKLSEEQVAHLKNQNGGLQTFLKNHKAGYVVNRGHVLLRTEPFEKFRLPTTTNCSCFFEKYLPNGCPYRDTCGFRHAADESIDSGVAA
uniref:tRNA (uracil-O(2)-)-methyltransferase n=1 Tax=Panagrellus redivivus TaxID=6233 RepID=A0A7E4VLM4_PANRE